MRPTWLSAAELDAWVRLAAVLELLPGVLDSQLGRDADLTHFEYLAMAHLSQVPRRTMRMTGLAQLTNATLPRLSHVAKRLENRKLVERFPCPQDGRSTNIRLTPAGLAKVRATAPGHVAVVRDNVIDALTSEQVDQLRMIMGAVLARLDPAGVVDGEWGPPRSGQPTAE